MNQSSCSFAVAFFSSSFCSYCLFRAERHTAAQLTTCSSKYQLWGSIEQVSQASCIYTKAPMFSYLGGLRSPLILCGHTRILLQLFSSAAEELVCLLVRSVNKVLEGHPYCKHGGSSTSKSTVWSLILATNCKLSLGSKSKWAYTLRCGGTGQNHRGLYR